MTEYSPFPGMDPYLEQYWGDVHAIFIAYLRDALQPQLPRDLVARVEERVHVGEEGQILETRRPDVVAVELPHARRGKPPEASSIAVEEPIVLHMETEPLVERSIQIINLAGRTIVTAIEVLSPWNKFPGATNEAYLKKRNEFLESPTNLVEIDLVRAGDWVRMVRPGYVPPQHRTTYRATVKRSFPEYQIELYPIHLRRSLPAIPIPLRKGEADVPIALQPLMERVYGNGRYDSTDYSVDCEPPLEADDAAWADELLKAAGKR